MGLSSQSVRFGPPSGGMIRVGRLGSETRFGLLRLPRGERVPQALRPNRRVSPLVPVRSCCALRQLSKVLLKRRSSSPPCRSRLVGVMWGLDRVWLAEGEARGCRGLPWGGGGEALLGEGEERVDF